MSAGVIGRVVRAAIGDRVAAAAGRHRVGATGRYGGCASPMPPSAVYDRLLVAAAVAAASEAAVRAAGAVPATVAVHDGRLLVGLDAAALEGLATAPAGSVRKAA